MDRSLPGSPVHGILQARTQEWIAMASPQGILPIQGSKPQILMSPALAARFFTTKATWEAQKDHRRWEKKK